MWDVNSPHSKLLLPTNPILQAIAEHLRDSIELSYHFFLRQGGEVIDVEALGRKDRSHVRRNQLMVHVGSNRQFYQVSQGHSRDRGKGRVPTVTREVEQWWQVLQLTGLMSGIRQFGIWLPEFVEEGVNHRIDSTQSFSRRVLQKLGDEVDSIGVGLTEDLAKRVGLDLGKFVFHVVGVHGPDLLACRCTQNLDDLNQLVDSGFAREKWLSQHQLCHDATRRPHI